jgi:hypothetical protein
MDNYILPEVERQRKLRNVSQFIFILDTSGVTLRKVLHLQGLTNKVSSITSYILFFGKFVGAQTRIRFIREFEAYFPEVLHSCYILNGKFCG